MLDVRTRLAGAQDTEAQAHQYARTGRIVPATPYIPRPMHALPRPVGPFCGVRGISGPSPYIRLGYGVRVSRVGTCIPTSVSI
jgi:hypothetical protein